MQSNPSLVLQLAEARMADLRRAAASLPEGLPSGGDRLGTVSHRRLLRYRTGAVLVGAGERLMGCARLPLAETRAVQLP